MCARRFLMLIVILTLIVVGGSFAVYQWGGQMLLRSATPKGHYAPPPPNSGPDYTKPDSWLTRPGTQRPKDPAQWNPTGAPPPRLSGTSAALFYIHPTTYLKNDRWNAPASGVHDSDLRDLLFVQSQASAFNDVAEVWAPRYRQAAYGAFLLKSEDAQKALNLAYSDVSAAFDEFMKRVPAATPIILAGHSQGALHLMRLLQERHGELKGRLVAAYVVGWPIGISADLPALGYPACRAADQAGCILSWMSFRNPPNPRLILDQWTKTKGPTGGERRRGDILCVNPITGTEGGVAPPRANPGTLVPSMDFKSGVLEAGHVGARCEDGLLIIDGDLSNLGPYVLPGNNYHVYDYALFWGSIRADAERRVTAWRAQ
jgi:hypothetical protein